MERRLKTRSSTRINLLAKERSEALNESNIDIQQDVFRTPKKRPAKSAESASRLHCSPPKQKCGSVPVERNLSTPKSHSPSKPNREDSKAKQLQETRLLTPNARLNDNKSPVCSPQVSQCHKTLQALHESSMMRPLCRDEEINEILSFLCKTVKSQAPGSLYVTGPPGTGKTACVMYCTRNHKLKAKFKTIIINCMTLRTAKSIFRKIADELGAASKRTHCLPDLLKQHLCRKGPIILLVLDEMDQLDSRHQEVLYNVFEWSSLPNSRLVLIGIANALEPLDRTLPRLKILTEQETSILQFQPYTKDQIKSIVEDRLQQCKEDNEQLVTPTVIEYCSRNAAANNGDVRKALSMLSQATMMVMNSATRSSPRKQKLPAAATEPVKSSNLLQVKLQHIQQVVNSVSSSLAWVNAAKVQLPLQQKILVFCLISLLKSTRAKDATVGKLYEAYCRISRKKQLTVVDSSEVFSLCSQLEDSGIVGIKKNKDVRFAKISLKVDEMDLEPILRQEKLLATMLDDTSYCQK